MNAQRRAAIVRLALAILLALSMTSLAGCDEALLAKLTPEQRAYYYRLLGRPVPVEATVATAATTPETPEVVSARVLPVSWSEGLAADDRCSSLAVSAPRGLACLHCTQAEAKRQARLIALLLFRSCLQNIAINYLVDGTFGYDEELLKEHITLLTSGDRRLFLHFYLSNGPWQRDPRGTTGFANGIDPERFRSRIQSDQALQLEYKAVIERLIPVLRYAAAQGAIISLVPALEDNLDDASFAALNDLTLQAVPSDIPVAIGRNPCPGCYDGNTATIPDGVFREEHTTSAQDVNFSDGLVTNDGAGYTFSEDHSTVAPGDRTLADLAAVRDRASSLNDAFILWSAERQGILKSPGTKTYVYRTPEEREYQIPDMAEREALITFLRENTAPGI